MTTMTGTPTGIEKTSSGAPQTMWQEQPRAVGYIRQDFEEMGKKWTRPDGQKNRICACAEAHRWQLTDVHEDIGWTGECLNRPALIALLSEIKFDVLIVDRTDRLACKKADLDFLLALLEEHGVTCVPATWSWEPLAQYMRWWYRSKGNTVYAQLEAATAKA
jgi:Resolvase, N terminal domain